MSDRDAFRAEVKSRIKTLERKSRRSVRQAKAKVSKASAKIIEMSARRHAPLMVRLAKR